MKGACAWIDEQKQRNGAEMRAFRRSVRPWSRYAWRMEIRPCSVAALDLSHYTPLFAACFPSSTHLDERYLRWLYAGNPEGEVVGMDAFANGQLVAHYACVPAHARIHGVERRVLLSLNTATHPAHQGKGLFTQLAEATYRLASEQGFHAVYGVANAQSTPGFVRKLGFSLLSPLDARLGFGAIGEQLPEASQASAAFHRLWSPEALRWRGANPHRPFRWHRPRPGTLAASAATGRWGIRAWAELPDASIDGAMPSLASSVTPAPRWAPRLHLGLRPRAERHAARGWFDVPRALRPSPLNLIYRPLTKDAPPEPGAIFFDFLDFDAY
jgi:GNAT superfamily N-acetyltransferase